MTIGKNNFKKRLHKDSTRRVGHYSLRKLSVGVASVLLSTTLFFGVSGSVDTNFTLGLTSVEAASATPVVSASDGISKIYDGDGYSDSIEKAGGSNPNDSNSTPENYGKEPTTPNEGGTTTDPTNPT